MCHFDDLLRISGAVWCVSKRVEGPGQSVEAFPMEGC